MSLGLALESFCWSLSLHLMIDESIRLHGYSNYHI
jgi:hypothetical protein